MAQTGPLTKNTSQLALGMAQIRVGPSIANIGTVAVALTSGQSIGAVASTRLTLTREYYKHEAGFPLLEDAQIPIRENAQLEAAFEEINAYNMMLTAGKDPVDSASGQIELGALASPTYLRMEAHYTFPGGTGMFIVFPRTQILSNTEIDFQKEENAKVPLTFKAQRADGLVSGGSAVWNAMPLGRVYFSGGTPGN